MTIDDYKKAAYFRVGEIAERLGFKDALYFSRLFSKHARMPPLPIDS